MDEKRVVERVPLHPDDLRSPTPPPITLEQRDRVRNDPDSEPDLDVLNRILEKVFVPLMRHGSIAVAAEMLRKTETYGSLRTLLEELDLLDEWEITLREPGAVTKQDVGTTQFLLILRFLESIVDREGWYTATWFKEQYGIPASRLRTAAKRGQLAKMGEQRKTVYSYESARRLWPQEITHSPLPKRDKA